MAGVTLTVESQRLRRELSGLIARLENPADALMEIGEVLAESTKRRFASQSAPDGSAWAPNTPVTRARKTNPNILTESGLLGDGIRYQLLLDGEGVAIGTDRIYAAVQQFGQPKGASGTTQRGAPIPWGDIPARPFLGLSADDEDAVLRILRDYVSG